MKIKVEVIETRSKVIEIEAADEQEAILIAIEKYKEEEIVFDESDHSDADFSIYFD